MERVSSIYIFDSMYITAIYVNTFMYLLLFSLFSFLSFFLIFFLLLFFLLQHSFSVLRVASINITFLQISSSLPSVIEVEWPEEWSKFVRNFNFVKDLDTSRNGECHCHIKYMTNMYSYSID